MKEPDLIEEIRGLKQDTVILSHNYQRPEIQDIADYIGDSLDLARLTTTLDTKAIVFCGVHFMAESAQILSPEKEILLPRLDAGCPLANMVTPEALREYKAEHPDVGIVTYINSSAGVKAESDVCCTSANAVKVVSSIPFKKILFVPDKNLGRYVSKQIRDKEVYLWEGHCHVHQNITPADILEAKAKHPEAKVMIHPECTTGVLDLADFILSTGGMVRTAKEDKNREFIVVTEEGMTYRLQKENPDKVFYNISPLPVCPNMKKTHLEDVLLSLKNRQHRIVVEEGIALKAKKALDEMLRYS
jgi:quinolinate synthase